MIKKGFHTSCLMGKRVKNPSMSKSSKPDKQVARGNIETSSDAAVKLDTKYPDCVLISVHLKPGARTTALSQFGEDCVNISVAAPPVDGQANTELIAFIASVTGVKKSHVTLKSGHKSRDKVLSVSGLQVSDVQDRLRSAISQN